MTSVGRAPGRRLRPPGCGIPRGLAVLFGPAAVVVAAAGIHAMAWLAGPLFLALTVVVVVGPVRSRLSALGLPAWLATAALVAAVYAVVGAFVVAVVVVSAGAAAALPRYAGAADALVADVQGALSALGVGAEPLAAASGAADLDRVAAFAASLLSELTGLAGNLVLLLALLLFMAVEAAGAGTRVASIAADRPRAAGALRDVAAVTRAYLVATTVLGLVVAALDTLGLWLLGVPLAPLWGLLAFLTAYIPVVGGVVALVPPALLGLLEGGWPLAVSVVVVYAVVNLVLGSLLRRRLTGAAVDLSVAVTFLMLLFWPWLIGPIGVVLAIPLTLFVKVLLIDIDPRARWAEALLGTVPKDLRSNPADPLVVVAVMGQDDCSEIRDPSTSPNTFAEIDTEEDM